jgi:hypothetical protein
MSAPIIDILDWVNYNALPVEEIERKREFPFEKETQNYRTRSDRGTGPMHKSGQMDTITLNVYSVENSMYLQKEGIWYVCGVKILCTSRETKDGEVWEPRSYINTKLDGDDDNTLWIRYPATSEADNILKYSVDTEVKHRNAVQATINVEDDVPFKIFVPDCKHGAKFVHGTCRIVCPWRVIDGSPAYQIRLVKYV